MQLSRHFWCLETWRLWPNHSKDFSFNSHAMVFKNMLLNYQTNIFFKNLFSSFCIVSSWIHTAINFRESSFFIIQLVYKYNMLPKTTWYCQSLWITWLYTNMNLSDLLFLMFQLWCCWHSLCSYNSSNYFVKVIHKVKEYVYWMFLTRNVILKSPTYVV